jgi:beta-lactamase superfamily II metal-dependent hydrolase
VTLRGVSAAVFGRGPRGLAVGALCCLVGTLSGCSKDPAPTHSVTAVKQLAKSAPDSQAPAVAPAPSLEDESHFGGGGDGKLHVYFLNVGQGDATLIVSPVGKTVLIDAGGRESSARISHRLPDLVNDSIDLLVLTQPHPDHFGGMSAAVKAVGAKRFLDPHLPTTDEGYAQLVAELKAREIPTFIPAPDPKQPGEPLRIKLGGGADLVVFWPRLPQESLIEGGDRTPQINSLVARLEFRETSLLLASDAQMETERLLLKRRLPFNSTLLRVAAHGAEGSSTAEFLSAVSPVAAIISVGAGNADGMPSRSVTERLERIGTRVFRTDLDGDVEAWSDGKSFSLSVERPPAGEPVGTEYLFAHNAPAKTWVNPQRAVKSQRADAEVAAVAPSKHTDTSVTVDLSDGAGSGAAVVAKSQRTQVAAVAAKEETDPKNFKKVVEVDSSSLIPDSVKQKYGPTKSAKATGDKSIYVASKNAKVFHFPNCTNAKRIKKENLMTFNSRSEAAKRFKPAGDCNP